MSFLGATPNAGFAGSQPQNFGMAQQQMLDLSGRGAGANASQNSILNPSLAGTYAQQGNTRTFNQGSFGAGLQPPSFNFPSLSQPASLTGAQSTAQPQSPQEARQQFAPNLGATDTVQKAPAASSFSPELIGQVGQIFGGNIDISQDMMGKLASLFGGQAAQPTLAGGGEVPQGTGVISPLNQQQTLSMQSPQADARQQLLAQYTGPALQNGPTSPQADARQQYLAQFGL